MEIHEVDPFDIEWEDRAPTYRVQVWSRPDARGAVPAPLAWRGTTYRLVGAADVAAVLNWAQAHTPPGGKATVAVEIERGGLLGVLRLCGIDPTDPDQSAP